jgi:acetyltransferase
MSTSLLHIERASSSTLPDHLPRLNRLLIKTINAGASMGWLPPLSEAAAASFWRARNAELAAGSRAIFLAWEGDALIGSAQLSLEARENGDHRAEVQKLMVDTDYRRRGVGEALMRALEQHAIAVKRSLLFLDTREGDPSEQLYAKLGYQRVGAIPNYVRNPDGAFAATVIYCKILETAT